MSAFETQLDHTQRHTLAQIWQHPTPANLKWSHVLAMLKALGTVIPESGDRYRVSINDHTAVIRTRSHDHDVPLETVINLRHYLSAAAGASTSAEATVAADHDSELLIVLDHHSANIYQLDHVDPHRSTVRPYDPSGRLRHLNHVRGRDQGRQTPQESDYYRTIAAHLGDASRIVIFGHGDGHADTTANVRSALRQHRPDKDPEIRTARVDASALTEYELIAAARKAFDAADEHD